MRPSTRMLQAICATILWMVAPAAGSASATLQISATILPRPEQQLRDQGSVNIRDQDGNVYQLSAEQRYRFQRDPLSVIREILPPGKGQGPYLVEILY